MALGAFVQQFYHAFGDAMPCRVELADDGQAILWQTTEGHLHALHIAWQDERKGLVAIRLDGRETLPADAAAERVHQSRLRLERTGPTPPLELVARSWEMAMLAPWVATWARSGAPDKPIARAPVPLRPIGVSRDGIVRIWTDAASQAMPAAPSAR